MSNFSKEQLEDIVYARVQHSVASMRRRLVEIENQRSAIQTRIEYEINWCEKELGETYNDITHNKDHLGA